MNLSATDKLVRALCETARSFGARGWCSATSGNFSARSDDGDCVITRSGRDKANLSDKDLMRCDLAGSALDDNSTPSAETPLHTALYRLDEDIGSVLHTHSVAATVISMECGSALELTGYEMQKALSGVTTHEDSIRIRVFPNDQDMARLAGEVADAWAQGAITVPGFLIAGHGLYAWGRDIAEARRHVEGFEFLFECHLARQSREKQ